MRTEAPTASGGGTACGSTAAGGFAAAAAWGPVRGGSAAGGCLRGRATRLCAGVARPAAVRWGACVARPVPDGSKSASDARSSDAESSDASSSSLPCGRLSDLARPRAPVSSGASPPNTSYSIDASSCCFAGSSRQRTHTACLARGCWSTLSRHFSCTAHGQNAHVTIMPSPLGSGHSSKAHARCHTHTGGTDTRDVGGRARRARGDPLAAIGVPRPRPRAEDRPTS